MLPARVVVEYRESDGTYRTFLETFTATVSLGSSTAGSITPKRRHNHVKVHE